MPLGNPPLILCATPAYLARHGRPRVPADLAKHTVMRGHTAEGSPDTLQLRRDGEEQTVWLRPALRVNDPALVHASVAASLGIGVLPEFLCRQGLARDKLERVLAGLVAVRAARARRDLSAITGANHPLSDCFSSSCSLTWCPP